MFSRIGATELLLVLAIVLLIFGPKNLPKLGKAIGDTVSAFRSGHKESAGADGEEKKASSNDDTVA